MIENTQPHTIRSRPEGTVDTKWALYTYDVWANEGVDYVDYEVHDVFLGGIVELTIPQIRHNIGLTWHVCQNPECPGNNPCGHNPLCEYGAHRRESHGVIPIIKYDGTTARTACPECDEYTSLGSQEFVSACPTNEQLAELFGVDTVETAGDDTHIYVDDASDGKPLGELRCVSHESLSPVRKA